MASFSDFLRTLNEDPGKKGREFELFVKHFLKADPEWTTQVEEVWLWDEFPGRWGPDCGIDLVFKDKNGEHWAVQAKCYAPEYEITKSDVDRFLSESNRKEIQYRLLISTTDRINANAKRVCEAQEKLVVRYGLSNFESAVVDYPSHIDQLLNVRRGSTPTPRAHQLDAVDAVSKGFLESDKGQLIMACGTGKTYTSLWIKEKIKAKSAVVLVPTLGLLSQTLREWTAASNDPFEVLCVCSDTTAGKVADETVHSISDLAFPVTSDHGEIAHFLKKDVAKVIFATYQSSRLIAEAQTDQTILDFDLIIADEAHRLAGKATSEFSIALDNKRLRAKKRLFATATPRVYATSVKKSAESRGIEIVSMEEGGAFGEVFFKLPFGEAIRRGLLTDYRVVVIGVDDQIIASWIENRELLRTDTGYENDAESMGTQIGLLKGMKDYDLKRVISFHSKIKRAEQFSKDLNSVADWVASTEDQAERIQSDYVSGEMPTFKRRQKLRDLKNLQHSDRRVLSNARCLAEGIDVPTLDGVAFIDPKSSQVEIIQALGRAIRLSPDKKVGTIILPVFLANGASVEELAETSGFRAIWSVLNALKAHDDDLANELNQLRFELGRNPGKGVKGDPPKVTFDLPRMIDHAFVDKLKAITVEQTSESWEFWFGLLERFVAENRTSRVPARYETPEGYKLGIWVNAQRGKREPRGNRQGLTRQRISRLEALPGWAWDVNDARWDEGLSHLDQYVREYGNTRMNGSYIAPDGFRLGNWVKHKRIIKEDLSAERQAQLEKFPDWVWNVIDAKWEEGFSNLVTYVREFGNAKVHANYKAPGNQFPLGSWVSSKRATKDDLNKDQIDRLESLSGWTWNALDERWETGFQSLVIYIQKNGSSRVPARFIDETGYKLGSWVAKQRKDIDRLAADKRDRLEKQPEWTWDPFKELWDQGYEALDKYSKEHGSCNVPRKTVLTIAGNDLNIWINRQRTKRQELNPEQTRKLELLPGWSWNPQEEAWLEMCDELDQYAKNHGNCLVPTTWILSNGKNLGHWANDQRKKRDKLSLDQQNRLESIRGWTWDAVRYKWDKMFNLLSDYANAHGTCSVPYDLFTEDRKRLADFVNVQRNRRSELGAEREKMLEALPGWTWDPALSKWQDSFKKLKKYVHETGSSEMLSTYKTKDGYNLGSWVRNQRKNRLALSPEQVSLLEGLVGWRW